MQCKILHKNSVLQCQMGVNNQVIVLSLTINFFNRLNNQSCFNSLGYNKISLCNPYLDRFLVYSL